VKVSWERQGWPLRILRAFLGATFVYAGTQKLADPNFLRSGTPDFIGSQLHAFATGSPIRGLLLFLDHFPDLTGLGIALLETAVGVATLLGVAPITAAAVGFGVNLMLMLSATWHVHPYFLGSDSMYAVAWLAYGAGLVEMERRAARAAARSRGRRSARVRSSPKSLSRREVLRGAAVAGATLFMGGMAGALALPRSDMAGAIAPARSRDPDGHSPTSPPSPARQVQGTPVAKLDSIPVGGAAPFDAPGVGPAVLVRLGSDQVAAYSRVCTHAGCLVDYDQQQRLLACPCHGAEFDPARGAEPVAGPAPSPLARIQVALDPSTGEVVVPG